MITQFKMFNLLKIRINGNNYKKIDLENLKSSVYKLENFEIRK